ncbi:hypothetical protein ACHAW5_005288 [Stephanodiscus triporus]|uniref:RNA helicase n=1 Tax=Stephanodiscus triporus TaxID=2934178 RepID=A0ABD3QV39_9STRA
MGKNKPKGVASGGGASAAGACKCDHPYDCSCGMRPPRPSRGHKWDTNTMTWGGKGHKQKGGSGQTAVVAVEAKVTTGGGNVAVKQWQRLPTEMLAGLLRKGGRRRTPVYRRVGGGGGGYRYRLILPDDSDIRDRDVVLTPAHPVDNEEQAREEAGLLGLLHLYPSLPHERTLPEPYRSTFLAARALAASAGGGRGGGKVDDPPPVVDVVAGGASINARLVAANAVVVPNDARGGGTTTTAPPAATAATVLLTKAQVDEARRLRRVEERGTDGGGRRADGEGDADDDYDAIRSYVVGRLTHEGFAPSHVSRAYREATTTTTTTTTTRGKGGGGGGNAPPDDAGRRDAAYEDALQYLCISPLNHPAMEMAGSERELMRRRCAFWKFLTNAASLPIERTCCHYYEEGFGRGATTTIEPMSDEDRHRNEEAAANEREAMEAIFEEGEFSIVAGRTLTSVFIALPFGEGEDRSSSKLSLEVHYTNGMYPDLLPMAFVTSGKWNIDDDRGGGGGDMRRPKINYRCGGRIHLNLVRYLSEITTGQEVIFELFGYVQSLLQEEEASPTIMSSDCSGLLTCLKLNDGLLVSSEKSLNKSSNVDSIPPPLLPPEQTRAKNDRATTDDGDVKTSKRIRPRRREEQRATFWNTHPSRTPPAVSFPKLSTLLERSRRSLPAAKARDEFLSLLAKANAVGGGRVLLVTGETGCGKTTQIPQFILENSPDKTKIIVAQPRRLAAVGVASRVASERAESDPGTASVGYVVRGDSKICPSTRLLFCTTGVLLRQLQSRNALENITHIVIDEVHERNLDSDVLIAILKQTLPLVPNLSVVLMSATMDADRFAKYFGESTPRMHIPGFTHPVQDFMLEDVLEMTGYIPPKKNPANVKRYDVQDDADDPVERNPSSTPMACSLPLNERLKRMNENEIDYNLVSVLIKTLLQQKEDDGSILVFLPGAGEIDRAERAIYQIVKGHAITILPLHGGLQPEKQQQVFLPAKKGYTKIILATNVAETSITIPDCTVVVDTCKEKQSSFDPVNRMPLLLEQFASQDSLRQRRGRAGRVKPGACYKLISSSLHNKLPKHGEAEIRRCALDQTILSLLFLGLENGSGSFLRILLDPPNQQQIDSALHSLNKIGALERNGDLAFLTPLGTHLAGIPAPPVVGKLLIMGCLLGCRDISVAIAAALSAGRSPFLRIDSFNNGKHRGKDDTEQEKVNTNKEILEARAALFKMVGNSDHVMLGKAFLLWKECNGPAERRRYCDRLGLAFNSMREILALTRQLDAALTTLGFHPTEFCNKNENSWRIVRSVLVASLSPTQVVRVQRPSAKYTETVEGAVEKDGKAKELKFFIRGGSESMHGHADHDSDTKNSGTEERVFIHPSSNNFAVGSFSCPWIVYHRLIRTSKAFICDATECNPYSLLLFGGTMEVQASKGLILLDDWIRLSANARIGSLIGGLRRRVDELLELKVTDPSMDIAGSTEMELITE